MKKLIVLLLLAAVARPIKAQDSLTCSMLVVPLTGTALMATGALLTWQPAANEFQVALRDRVVQAELPKLHIDDYAQYLPMSVPVVLNLCGLKGRHSLDRLILLEGGSYLFGSGWLNAFKYKLAVLCPDGSTYNSFPSGHTFTAFVGAEIIRREYGREYPWIAVAGYATATLIGAMRIYNNRHWLGDVAAGAGLGILSVSLVSLFEDYLIVSSRRPFLPADMPGRYTLE